MGRQVIADGYERAACEPSDMMEHMQTIRYYASQCQSAVELGVYDCTSTWALLAGFPERLTSYDIARRVEVDDVERAAEESGTKFTFVLGDSAAVEIEEVDLLFIDSLHTYEHLKKELELHARKTRKFILMHDTTTFGEIDQTYEGRGLWPAVVEFLEAHPEWSLRERFTNCNGLTVLARSKAP